MRLEELVNENHKKLNENDLLIWQYIQSHKKECSTVSIGELAKKCCISRTTISRFAQKLSFEGFRELKMHLKLEYEGDQTVKTILLDDVCQNYQKGIEAAKDTDMRDICEHISGAERLFVFGTGRPRMPRRRCLGGCFSMQSAISWFWQEKASFPWFWRIWEKTILCW